METRGEANQRLAREGGGRRLKAFAKAQSAFKGSFLKQGLSEEEATQMAFEKAVANFPPIAQPMIPKIPKSPQMAYLVRQRRRLTLEKAAWWAMTHDVPTDAAGWERLRPIQRTMMQMKQKDSILFARWVSPLLPTPIEDRVKVAPGPAPAQDTAATDLAHDALRRAMDASVSEGL